MLMSLFKIIFKSICCENMHLICILYYIPKNYSTTYILLLYYSKSYNIFKRTFMYVHFFSSFSLLCMCSSFWQENYLIRQWNTNSLLDPSSINLSDGIPAPAHMMHLSTDGVRGVMSRSEDRARIEETIWSLWQILNFYFACWRTSEERTRRSDRCMAIGWGICWMLNNWIYVNHVHLNTKFKFRMKSTWRLCSFYVSSLDANKMCHWFLSIHRQISVAWTFSCRHFLTL